MEQWGGMRNLQKSSLMEAVFQSGPEQAARQPAHDNLTARASAKKWLGGGGWGGLSSLGKRFM